MTVRKEENKLDISPRQQLYPITLVPLLQKYPRHAPLLPTDLAPLQDQEVT